MSGFLFAMLVALIVLVAVGYVVGSLDHLWRFRLRQFVAAIVVALALSTVLYAAELQPSTCNDYPKYGVFWYAYGCWLWEHSS